MKRLFRQREHDVPALNTAALPDLIFTVLFFFMIVTHMRDVELKVRYQVPQGTELEKVTHKASVVYIYIGHPADQPDGDVRIQLNDRYAEVADIPAFIEEERNRMSAEDAERLTVSIKADKDTPVGLIADVKHALQAANALRINYSAVEK